jgi:hypothetical protein
MATPAALPIRTIRMAVVTAMTKAPRLVRQPRMIAGFCMN